jgi:hypothetical protein
MPAWPFIRPPTQPEQLLADTHERIRQTTQRIREVRELLYRIESVARRQLGTSEQNGEDPPPRPPAP